VFAGTINNDLISVAMREAGLRKYHEILGWAMGSGFPKATRIDTQVDKAAGVGRKTVGLRVRRGDKKAYPIHNQHYDGWGFSDVEKLGIVTAPTTPLAQAWEGHRYGGQMLKPSLETVLVFQKLYEDKPVDCITETGAGALWVDGARIRVGQDYQDAGWGPRYGATSMPNMGGHQTRPWVQEAIAEGEMVKNSQPSPQGRWPANFYLQHHPECIKVGTTKVKQRSGSIAGTEPSHTGDDNTVCYGEYDRVSFQRYADGDGFETVAKWRCSPDCPVRKIGEQGGRSKSQGGSGKATMAATARNVYGSYAGDRLGQNAGGLGDVGTVARFFYQSHWMYERLEQTDPILYQAKATRKERDAGLSNLPLQIRNRVNPGGLENEPRWSPVKARNPHPTVKPIALTKWLATLLLPPPEYAPRRLLVPFAGSGSEMIGALLAGWEEIVGVELLRENVNIARARIAWWQKWVEMGCNDVGIILKDGIGLERDTPTEQLAMF